MYSIPKLSGNASQSDNFLSIRLAATSRFLIQAEVICLGLCAALILAGSQAALGLGAETGLSVTNSPGTNSGPRIEFTDLTHDFGRVESGKLVTNTYSFINRGNQPLEIRDIQSSCGCAAAENYSRVVAPGQKGVVPVIFDSTGRAGQTTRTIKIISNDPAEPTVVLQFTALVWKPIDAIPVIAAFDFGPDFQTNRIRVIRLVSNLDEPVTLSEPVCTNRSFRAELKVVKEGREFELHVEVIPPLGAGSWSAPITLKTSSAKMPVVTVRAYAMVQPAITLRPPALDLPSQSLTEEQAFTVTIRNNGTNALSLSEPTINAPGAKVQLREVQPGRSYSLIVTFPPGFRSEPGQVIEARIKSNAMQSPIVKVPVRVPITLDDNATEASAVSSGLPAAAPPTATQK